jgi:hypothetical protein
MSITDITAKQQANEATSLLCLTWIIKICIEKIMVSISKFSFFLNLSPNLIIEMDAGQISN